MSDTQKDAMHITTDSSQNKERMTMSKVWIETIRRVGGEEGFLEIGPHPDAPREFLELRTVPGAQSEEYYGPLNLSLSPDLARHLGQALIAAADEMQKK